MPTTYANQQEAEEAVLGRIQTRFKEKPELWSAYQALPEDRRAVVKKQIQRQAAEGIEVETGQTRPIMGGRTTAQVPVTRGFFDPEPEEVSNDTKPEQPDDGPGIGTHIAQQPVVAFESAGKGGLSAAGGLFSFAGDTAETFTTSKEQKLERGSAAREVSRARATPIELYEQLLSGNLPVEEFEAATAKQNEAIAAAEKNYTGVVDKIESEASDSFARAYADEAKNISKWFQEARDDYGEYEWVNPEVRDSTVGQFSQVIGEMAPLTVTLLSPSTWPLAFSQIYENVRENERKVVEARGENFDPSRNYGGRTLLSAANIAIERALGVERVIKGALKATGKETAKDLTLREIVKDGLKTGAAAGLGEAPEEMTQGTLEDIFRKTRYDVDYDMSLKEFSKRRLTEAIMAFFAGGLIGTGTSTLQSADAKIAEFNNQFQIDAEIAPDLGQRESGPVLNTQTIPEAPTGDAGPGATALDAANRQNAESESMARLEAMLDEGLQTAQEADPNFDAFGAIRPRPVPAAEDAVGAAEAATAGTTPQAEAERLAAEGAVSPASEPAPKAGQDKSTPSRPAGKRFKVPPPPSPELDMDLLNVIDENGGIKSRQMWEKEQRAKGTYNPDTGGEYDGLDEVMRGGPARLLRRKTGQTPDQMMKILRDEGYDFETPDAMYRAIEEAAQSREQQKQQLKDMEAEGKVYDAALENQGRSVAQRTSDPVFLPDLQVGDKFKFKGEDYRFEGIDEDTGEAILQDGVRLQIPEDTPLYVDRGQVEAAAYQPADPDDPFALEQSPEEYVLEAFQNNKAFDASVLEEYDIALPARYQIKNGVAEPRASKARASKREQEMQARRRRQTEETLEEGKEEAREAVDVDSPQIYQLNPQDVRTSEDLNIADYKRAVENAFREGLITEEEYIFKTAAVDESFSGLRLGQEVEDSYVRKNGTIKSFGYKPRSRLKNGGNGGYDVVVTLEMEDGTERLTSIPYLKEVSDETATPPPAAAEPLTLENLTPEQQAAEQAKLDEQAKTQQQRQDLEEGQAKRLEGDMGDAAQGRLLDDPDGPELFNAGRAPSEQPRPARTAPDWTRTKPETRAGRKQVDKINLDRKGQRIGPAHIMDRINRAIGVQVRKSKSQTSGKHPAHYRPDGHMVFTHNPVNGHYAFHEAGHGLKELIESRVPDFFKPFESELLAIQSMPGSYASKGPNKAYKLHEGVAEWLRRRIEQPETVEGMSVTRAIDTQLNEKLPDLAATIRDGARAWQAHQSRSAAARFSAEQQVPRSLDAMAQISVLGDALSRGVSQGSTIRGYDRRIYRAIVKNRKQLGKTRMAADKLARKERDRTRRLQLAHNYLLSIGSELQFALQGDRGMKGIRIYDSQDNLKVINPTPFSEIVNALGSKWQDFQLAGWAKSQLARANKGLKWTGRSNGVTIDDLKQIVADAENSIPKFNQHYKQVEKWFNDLLIVKLMGGLKSEQEVGKMFSPFEDYWPLPKQMQQRGVQGGPSRLADVQAGDYRATGSELPLRELVEVAEDRAHNAYRAYYYNQFGIRLVDEMGALAKNKQLPHEARTIAGRVITPLKRSREKVATVHEDEIKPWVLDAVNAELQARKGAPLEKDEKIKPEDLALFESFKDVWRGVRPTDVNVIGLLRNGEREYYMLEDAELFQMFAGHSDLNLLVKGISWFARQETQNWKRNITQSLPFAVHNALRDSINQIPLGRGPASFIPWAQTSVGLFNKFTSKYPQVFEQGLLLSRTVPTDKELVNRIKHAQLWNFISEGFWESAHSDPNVRLASTILQPGNLLNPAHKLVDTINVATGGRRLARLGEESTREGAAVLAKMQGESDGEAKQRYWEVTGQFNEGPGSDSLRTLFGTQGFVNPMLQSLRQHGERATDPDPAVSGAYWYKVLVHIPALASLGAYVMYKTMSDDDRKNERERTLQDRLGYMDVMGFRSPFAYGPEGALMSFAYNATMDHLLDRDTKWREGAPMLGKRVVDFNGMANIFGSLGDALKEAATNWDGFRQRHIVSPWLQDLPAQEQYGYNTPDFYKKLGRWTNYSPDKLRHIVTNGLARQLDEVVVMLDRIEDGKPLREMSDLPVVGRLFIRDPSGFNSASVQDLMKLETKLTLINRRMDALGLERAKDFQNMLNGTISDPTEQALAIQYQQLEGLRQSVGMIDRFQNMARQYDDLNMPDISHNARQSMIDTAQNALIHAPEYQDTIKQTLDTLEQMLNDAGE